jgi:hypothetical protein
VGNAVNTAGLRQNQTLEGAQRMAQQTDVRYQFDNQMGASLAKGAAAPSAVAPGSMVGGFSGAGGRGGGMGGGSLGVGGMSGPVARESAAASAPVVKYEELNLGNQSATGWQSGGSEKKDAGYRVINNYAQQTRVINNRSFFLNGNQWTEVAVQNASQTAKHVKVVFNSDAYFDLIAKHPEAAQYLALGNNVTIELGGTVYDIVEEDVVLPK